MLETVGWLHPFKTHEALKQGFKSESTKRLIVSIILLNLLPLLYFVILLNHLSSFTIQFPMNLIDYLKTLSVVLLTLSCFGFYRIYCGPDGLALEMSLQRKGMEVRKKKDTEKIC